jgi:hypothetical protein
MITSGFNNIGVINIVIATTVYYLMAYMYRKQHCYVYKYQ